jgi:enoyl-CoA hydratase/carnithine racemase
MTRQRPGLPVFDPADAPVVVTHDGAVATITLNRPEKRNALNAEVIAGIKAAILALSGDDAVRVIVLTGAGPDFCAGADLEQLERIAAGADAIDNIEDAQSLGDLFIRMRRVPTPIVAAVRGNAIAGGAGLAGACDIVLADEEAVFGYPEVHLGCCAAPSARRWPSSSSPAATASTPMRRGASASSTPSSRANRSMRRWTSTRANWHSARHPPWR